MIRKIVFSTLLLTLLLLTPAAAKEYKGVSLPEHYDLAGQTLQLNGQGMRSKFFFSIYVGALYTPSRVTSASQVMAPELPKVIRLHIVYDEISAEKFRNGFAESLDNNSAGFSRTDAGQKFLALFDFSVVKNDTVDLQFTPGGSLAVLHNGQKVGSLLSAAASQTVLKIYFGPEPIQSLKTGMLGG